MSEITRLIVVRHGNTFNSGDTILRVGSATDIPLTEKGLLQGEAVGKSLLAKGLSVDTIFHAPLQRTVQSAEGILKSYPAAQMSMADFLTELDYGDDDGKPEDEVVLRLGKAAFPEENSPERLYEAGKTVLKKWDSEAVLPPGWEFLAGRVAQLEKDWQNFAGEVLTWFSGKCVVAVTSNGIARFSKAILPAGSVLEGSLKLATGAYGIYEHCDGQWRCTAWNIRPEL
ncbi:MAG: histidine phosphatase family protein [Lentisphaeria bacterium]|nr:histidine phosphatase family protein [Lentisphaeria bacterium]